MKKKTKTLLAAIIIAVLFAISAFGQSTTNSYTQTLKFFSSDLLQLYQGARIAAPTMTLPNSLTTYTSTLPFGNSDNRQIYNAIRGIGDAVSTGSTNSWNITGNSISTNTNFIGTTSNRSLLFNTNNIQRMKLDSNGVLKMGTPTYTDTNIWSYYQGNGNNYYQSIWHNTSNGANASTDLVISNNLGTKTNYYGNFGMNSSTYTGTTVFSKPNAVYLTAQDGDLAIGTTSNNSFYVATNNTQRLKIDSLGFLSVSTNSYNNIFRVDNDGVYSLGAKGVVGSDNCAYGSLALPICSVGIENSAFGRGALYSNISGNANSAFGQVSLVFVSTGTANVGIGKAAGYGITSGFRNNILGNYAGFSNNGNQNVLIGTDVMYNATNASSNTIVGNSSYYDGQGSLNIVLGLASAQAMTTGSANTILGNLINIGNVNNNVAISNGTGQVVYRDNGTTAYNLRPLRIGSSTAPTATLDVTGTMSVSSTSTLSGLRNNGTFTTTGAAMIGGTTAGSATLHVLGTMSVQGASTLTTVNATGAGTFVGVLSTSSVVSTSKTAGIGYAVGSGSTVTQGTSRTTGVTINSITGSITLFSTAGSATYQSFTVTNSTVAANDLIIVNQRSGTDTYIMSVTAVAAGSFRITFATTGGTTTEAPVFNFAVIKGATN